MKQLALVSAVLAGCFAATACTPIPLAAPAALASDPHRGLFGYSCSVDGPVSGSFDSFHFTLQTQFGTEEFRGNYPTYYGDEASITFIGDSANFILAAPGEQQTCTVTGMG